MKYIIIRRGGQSYGPYKISAVLQYLDSESLLPHDLARDAEVANENYTPLKQLLKRAGISVPSSVGNPLEQALNGIKSIDLHLLLPWDEIKRLAWLRDKRLLYLAGIGLSPMFVLRIAPGLKTAYWLIALYFSALWSVFFYYLFRTPQVERKHCLACFFFTGVISIPILLIVQQIPPWTNLYALSGSVSYLPRFIGMFLGVGIHEELCKAAILFWLVLRPGIILMPQTMVLYGVMSGLGFGIYEGVNYQQTVNRAQGVDLAYFMNVARLTSLPFLHAIWTGIAGYFISFATIFPKKRYGLWAVGIAIPALLHAIYNTMGWSLPGLAAAFLGVVLLMMYLTNCVRMQQSLSKP